MKVRQYWICNGKEAKLFYFSKWQIPHIRAKQDTLRSYQASYSRHNFTFRTGLLLSRWRWPWTWWEILYKREKERFVVLATFWKNDNSSCFWYTDSFNRKSSFVFIYYKSEDGTPIFFIFLSSFDSIVHSFYIHNLAEKIFCGISFSKFLTCDYFLFFVSSSSIADSGTVWLDTYIKIIVICPDIHCT